MNKTLNAILWSLGLFFLWPMLFFTAIEDRVGEYAAQVFGLVSTVFWNAFLLSAAFWFLVLK